MRRTVSVIVVSLFLLLIVGTLLKFFDHLQSAHVERIERQQDQLSKMEAQGKCAKTRPFRECMLRKDI